MNKQHPAENGRNQHSRKQLMPRQLAVIDDIFSGQLEEAAVLARHKIHRTLYNKWLADERFIAEFDRRIVWLYRQSRALIASYTRLAAAKLVELTGSDKEETARKACLDIITMSPAETEPAAQNAESQQSSGPQLSESMASRLLAALAQTKEE